MRSVRTTFRILDAIADHQPIGLSELARQLGLPKSTVQRSLTTLADLDWIRQEGRESTRWALGERVRLLSEKVDDLGRLREAAPPVLERLNDETLETIHLAIPESGMMRLIERRESKHPLRFVQPIGTRSPLHAVSTGKSVLAFLPKYEIDAYLSEELVSLTPHTITDPDQVRSELEVIRERGYAVSNQEMTDGIISVAASIRPRGDRPIAAVSISGTAARMPAEVREEFGHKVVAAAGEIADNLR
ncbi:IclR family transcriptional regulator [Nocardia carnea]|uniref:IclR family transcriptional regulator n=1 Tax=Nocardia carnea TaxID=37328 RepID=UPI00245536E7|nr:IclR family transcriptional regulator [Nocardia carnea]